MLGSQGVFTNQSNLSKMYKLGTATYDTFKRYRNNLTQVIRTAKTQYYLKKFTNFRNNNKKKKIWQTINKLKGNTHEETNINSLQFNDTVFRDPSHIAEAFSKHFSTIAPKLDSNLPNRDENPKDHLVGNYSILLVCPIITTNDLETVMKYLRKKNSVINDIYPSVIKRNSHLFSTPLAILFNQSVTTATFSSLLKTAMITPIYKSGLDDDPRNYRPISQLTSF